MIVVAMFDPNAQVVCTKLCSTGRLCEVVQDVGALVYGR